MEQVHQILNTSRSLFKRQNSSKSKGSGQAGSGTETRRSEVQPVPMVLFPLSELLQELLQQEAALWKKNEGLRTAIKAGNGRTDRETVEPSFRSTGLTPTPTPTPTPSLTTSPIPTPTPTPPLTSHSPEAQGEAGRETEDRALCLIRYGRLTDDIHHYFRRLEKRHACLYLTKRKAKHENLRHVETQRLSEQEEAHGPEVQSAGYLLGAGAEGQLVTLREEELLVYRAGLMCAQFPMLSAPSPPEGASPTPTFPTLHFSNLGSPNDLARTAPSEMHEDQMIKWNAAGRGGAVSGNGSSSGNKTSPRIRRSPSERVKARGKLRESVRSPDESARGVVPPGPEEEADGDSRGPVSEPISIKGKTKSGLRRNMSSHSSSSSSRKQAKRLSMDAANMLPAVDSDEDDELAELSRPRTLRSRDSAHLVGREHPFSPMVNREMLCNLVRRAFKQTEEQQLQFEQILKHEYGRRSKGEILAKELAGQLQVLENNAHPFYKPKLFVTRNGYDQWLQAEKQRVRSLIDKFWHFSLPRPQLWRHYNPTDYHRAYSILLTRIVCCESRTERREPVHAGKTPSSPLSPTAQRLLNEFGLRYGVGELYRKIVYLDYLARHFDYEVWYIRHCTEELRAIRDLLPRNRNKITAVRKEMDLLKTTVHLLHGQTDNCLTKIDRLFQDSPTEGVASLIELLAEVLDAELSLFGKRVVAVEEWLKRYLKRGFALRYERRKEIHADETMHSRTAKPFVPTPALVNALLFSIKDEVKDYREKFQPVFRPYFDIVPFARVEFYRLMCADACSLCLRTIHKPEARMRLNLEMLGLLYRLNERDNEWENVIPPDMQQWRHSFVDLAIIWMEVLGKQINRWILDSVSKDMWTLLIVSTGTSDSDATFPAVPAQQTAVRHTVRPSPFPSPGYTPVNRTPNTTTVGSIGTNGAFMPYHQLGEERRGGGQRERPMSGRIPHSPPDSPVTAVAGIPDLVMKGAKRAAPSRPSPQDNIMRFWQAGKDRGFPNREELEHSSTVEPAHEIEVSVSVYDSREPSPSPPTPILHSPSTRQPTQNRVSPMAEHSPLQPLATSPQSPPRGSGGGQQENGGMREPDDRLSPPPLPTPVEENETVLANHAARRTSEREEEERGEDGRDVHGEEWEREKRSRSGAVLQPGSNLSNGVVENHFDSSSASSVSLDRRDDLHPCHPEDRHHQQQQQQQQQDQRQHSSSHSEYHTPSPITDDELKQLSHGELVTETEALPSPVHVERPAGREGSGHREQEEQTDGVVYRSSAFSAATTTTTDPVKFDNLLDECGKEEMVRPKPRAHRSATSNAHKANTSLPTAPEPIPTSSSSLTAREPAVPTEDIASGSSTVSSYHDTSHNNLKSYSSLSLDRHSDVEESIHHEGEGRERKRGDEVIGADDGRVGWRVTALSQENSAYLFPVSNSPLDIVTMLTRLACFTGTLLNTLTPKLRHGAVPGLDDPRRLHDYAPDVAMAKRQASQQLKNVENTHLEFLKKLHKIMCNSLKLYADNLICMDLCCCSSTEAMELLGPEMLHHLQRRKDAREIWGCRHMVEVRHGLHPNGIPCHKKKNVKFESITRDMCLRINNLHTLITIFPSLESHLHSTTRTEPHKPATAFGYISSDVGDQPSPLHRPRAALYNVGMSLRSQADKDRRGLLVTSSDHSRMPRESSVSWGSSTRERDRGAERPEAGFASRDSDQVLEYLRNVQSAQLKLLCSRMNKFFRPALSLLLELKLGECGIEKRLHPLITFLARHRAALQKYIYPECFHTLMNHLWSCILQDLEEETVKLRESKKPVTDRAQMLLQALSHLMVFMNNREEGVPLHTLTPSCEYLLALLDVMTRSTDQLMSVFSKLSAPQFARSRLDLSRAPVPVDSAIIHTLRSQLHTYKKCFSGKEFVEQFLQLGRDAEAQRLNSSEPSTPSPLVAHQRSPGLGTLAYSSTGTQIVYTVHYAKEVGQYLLSERILLPLPNLSHNLSELESDSSERTPGSLGIQESSSIPSDHLVRRIGDGGTRRGAAASKHFNHISVEDSPQLLHKGYGHTHDLGFQTDLQESGSTPQLVTDIFVYSPQSLYKFSDVEDFESQALYHSQILTASAHPQAAGNLEEATTFERARLGMLFLVHDLLLQRAKKEKRAKQFLQTPRAVRVAEQRKQQHTNCDLIFKM